MLPALFALSNVARSAESYDNCAGFIDSVPTTIATQGVWCLRKDLSTAITSGSAITIATNNVTIDCNDFKLGGLAAGDSSMAVGIYGLNRQNATVRHCNVRGFHYGIYLTGAGHLVEDNRLDNNLDYGIAVFGENNRVRRNAVYDTGGYPGLRFSYGIYASADIIDNTVVGVFGLGANAAPIGIKASGPGTDVSGNQIRGLLPTGTGKANGIMASESAITASGNRITSENTTAGVGIFGGFNDVACTGNIVINYQTAYDNCVFASGNLP